MKKVLHIIRGVSGTGKSTLAQSIGCPHFEADQYFMTDNGYKFNPEHLSRAHAWCLNEVKEALSSGEQSVCVSNTFTQYWEIEPYVNLGKEYKYEIEVHSLTKVYGNIHSVPDDVVQRQKSRFESHEAILEKVKG